MFQRGSAKRPERFFDKSEAPSSPMEQPPGSFKLSGAKRETNQVAARDFGGRNPGRYNADAEPPFDQFFDGFHVSHVHDGIEDDLFIGKVVRDHSMSRTGAAVEYIALFVNFRVDDMSKLCPWVRPSDKELQCICEEGLEIKHLLVPRFEGDRAIDSIGLQQANGFWQVRLFNQETNLRIDFAKLLDNGGQSVSADAIAG